MYEGVPTQTGVDAGQLGMMMTVYWVAILAIAILAIAGLWMVFEKAGQKGWKAIIPFYNIWVLLEVVGRPTWWFFLFLLAFIPIVNLVALVMLVIVYHDLAVSFGHGWGFALGLIFLSFIFLPILGFGSSKYLGPAAAHGASSGTTSGPTPTPV